MLDICGGASQHSTADGTREVIATSRPDRLSSVWSSSSIDATHRLAIGKRAVMELGKPLLLQIGAHVKLKHSTVWNA